MSQNQFTINNYGEIMTQKVKTKEEIEEKEKKIFFNLLISFIKSYKTAEKFVEENNNLDDKTGYLKKLKDFIKEFEKFINDYNIDIGKGANEENYENFFNNNKVYLKEVFTEINKMKNVDKPEEYSWYNRFMYYIEQIQKGQMKEKDKQEISYVKNKILNSLKN